MAADVRAQEGMRQSRALKAQADAAKKIRALELLAEGLPMSEIGRILGRDRKTIRNWKQEANGGY